MNDSSPARLILTAVLAALMSACSDPASQAPEPEPDTAAPAGRSADSDPGGGAPFSAAQLEAADVIDAEDLRAVVAEIASDDYGGRGPGSDGDRMTRDYLAGRLEALGYAPGAADGYQQPFELVGITATQPPQWSFSNDAGTVAFDQGDEFIVASGSQTPSATLEDAEVVFVGYGIEAPEYQWNDFAGADLAGKVLLMLNNDPHWDPALFEGERRLYYGRWTYKYESAARQGAAGAIIIHTTPSAGYPWQVVQTSWSGTQFELPQGDEPRLQAKGWLTEDAAAELVALAGHDLAALVESASTREFEPVPLGVSTSITLENDISRTGSANVLGLLPGSDPALAREVVVVTAHHDHLGTDPAAEGDGIYNGARDNAAGVAVALEIAEALQALPQAPRRSVLINFVGAEEQGLLGSLHYARNPTFPPGRIAANVNFDGAGIWGETSDLGFVGLGKSDLDQVARTVADFQGRTLTGDQDPSKGYYYRSDQFSFARIGVPGMFPRSGSRIVGKPEGWGKEHIDAYTEHDYHQVSDELTDDWRFDGMVQDARFGFLATVLIANQEQMPRWNPGDEFEDERRAALEALAGP